MKRITKLLSKLALVTMIVATFAIVPMSVSAMTKDEANTIMNSLNNTNFHTGYVTFFLNGGDITPPINGANYNAVLYGLSLLESDDCLYYGVKTTYNGKAITATDANNQSVSVNVSYNILFNDVQSAKSSVADFNIDTCDDFIGLFYQTYKGVIPANACKNIKEDTLASDIAITDIRTSNSRSNTITYNGITYYGVTNANIKTYYASQATGAEVTESPVDLNRDAGGDYIYMYVTTDPAAGNPITGLYYAVPDSPDAPSGYTLVYNINGGAENFNSGTGDDQCYLLFCRAPYSKDQYREAYNNTHIGKYLIDLGILTGDNLSSALSLLESDATYGKNSWRIDYDMNLATDSSEYPYYIAKQTSDNADSAIYDIKVFKKLNTIPSDYTVINYYDADCGNLYPCDGNKYYYIAVSHNPEDGNGQPITNVSFTTTEPEENSENALRQYNGSYAFNLRVNNYSDPLYMVFTRANATATATTEGDVTMYVILCVVLIAMAGIAVVVARKRQNR